MYSVIFENVSKEYSQNVGLKNVDIKIRPGEFVFLVGPCGAGKTTFISLLLKETEADSGRIMLEGKDITHLGRREIPFIRQKLGVVFQDFRLLEKKTVYENVAFAMEVLHKNNKEIRERVPYVLNLVGLKDKGNKFPAELSAGEQQRVGIARAIANKPRVLICDEPTGNLDQNTAMEIMKLLEEINIRGTTIIMATHAVNIVNEMKKRVIALDAGHVVRDGIGTYELVDDEAGKKIDELINALRNEESSLSEQDRRTLYVSLGEKTATIDNEEVNIDKYLK